MPGRKPVPTELAALHGNPRKRAKSTLVAPEIPLIAEPPDWLTPAQREGWDYALRNAPAGLLKRIDRGILTAWIVAEDLHRQASEAQAQNSLLVKSPKTGTPMQSPYLAIVNRQALIMLRSAAELGFSPTSRPRAYARAADPVEGFRVGHIAIQEESLDAWIDEAPEAASIN